MSMSLRMLAVSAAFALAGAAFAATPQADQAAPAAKPHSAQQEGCRAQGLHELLPERPCSRSADGRTGAADKDEDVQCRRQGQGAQGRRAQDLHEQLSEGWRRHFRGRLSPATNATALLTRAGTGACAGPLR